MHLLASYDNTGAAFCTVVVPILAGQLLAWRSARKARAEQTEKMAAMKAAVDGNTATTNATHEIINGTQIPSLKKLASQAEELARIKGTPEAHQEAIDARQTLDAHQAAVDLIAAKAATVESERIADRDAGKPT